jgi:hypothetical protein
MELYSTLVIRKYGMVNEYGSVSGLIIGKENQSIRRKSARVT